MDARVSSETPGSAPMVTRAAASLGPGPSDPEIAPSMSSLSASASAPRRFAVRASALQDRIPMAPRPPFKKSLTPIGGGGIIKHTGKGGLQQIRGIGGHESLTGGGLGRLTGRYPKAPMGGSASMAMGPPPGPAPVPPGIGGDGGGLASPAVASTAPPVPSAMPDIDQG